MGDRANVVVIDDMNRNCPVWLYTHWNGWALPKQLLKVIGRQERWDESSYIARMIFSEMITGQLKEAIGFGIGTTPGDDNYGKVWLVDPANRAIGLAGFPDLEPIEMWSFENFIQLDPEWLEEFWVS